MNNAEYIIEKVIEELKNLHLLNNRSIRLVISIIMDNDNRWIALASTENEFNDMGSSYKQVRMNLFWKKIYSIEHKNVFEKDISFEAKIMPLIHFSFNSLVIETCLVHWHGSEVKIIFDPIEIKKDEIESSIKWIIPGDYKSSELEYGCKTVEYEAGWGRYLNL